MKPFLFSGRQRTAWKKRVLGAIAALVVLMAALCNGGSAEAREASPEWVQKLPAAEGANQLFVVAGVGQTTAWVSMHEKDASGNWHELMSTPGFIGKSGLGKTREGDAKTPTGVFRFNRAFGIAPDPGCAISYTQVDENIYWSGDGRPGMKYNQMVDIRELPDLRKDDSEHIVDYNPAYTYCLNISYNENCTPGLGSAIFLHCFRVDRPYTGGCIALPADKMRLVMQQVRPDCVVVIDSLHALSPATANDWGI